MLTNIINTYCSTIKNAGYYVGVYASVSWLDKKIESQIKNNYPIWVAQYYSKCEYEGKTYSYQKIPNNLNSGKSILPVEIIRKIQPNSNIPCISYEISSGKITEYESVSIMNHDL